MRRQLSRILLVTPLLLSACDASLQQSAASEEPTFEDYFDATASFDLEDDPENPIGDVGVVLEASDGGVVLADAIIPRVMRFGAGGELLAQFGMPGEGPLEFRQVGGLAEDRLGNIAAIDPRLGRVTFLSPTLLYDTTISLTPRPRGQALSMGAELLLVTAPADRASALTLMSEQWKPVWSLPMPIPAGARFNPYWGSVGSMQVAASSNTIAIAFSLLYPIYLYDSGGVLVDSLTTAPPSFRTAAVVPRGAFAGVDAKSRLEDWLSSFDVISHLALVEDSLLMVTHATLRTTQTGGFAREDHHLDVYHLPSRVKIAEEVPLPRSSRVLAGGRALYLLAGQPPDPWTIVAARFRRGAHAR